MNRLRIGAVNVCVLVLLLLVAEGVAGYGSFWRAVLMEPEIAERRHTRYDPLLGWANQKWANIPDMYGRGISLQTNGQGFRSAHDFSRDVSPGRIRIICSGDSFTLGYGVDNDHTWCQRLASLDARVETVNMGQGGYGVDQAYLWYQRDGGLLAHQFQIFAFITEDFDRAADAEFWGYGKPLLRVDGPGLTVTNVPVPGPSNSFLRRLWQQSRRLHTVNILGRVGQRFAKTRAPRPEADGNEGREVVHRILVDLQRLNHERSSTLILVHLPSEDDLGLSEPPEWIQFIDREARAQGIPFVSLLSDFDRLPPYQIARLFFREGDLDYPGSAGHYTVAGNDLVARLLLEKLQGQLAAR